MNRDPVTLSSTILSFLLKQRNGVKPKRSAKALLAIAACLTLLSVVAQLSVHFFGAHPPLLVFERVFSVHRELNVPTLYAAFLLSLCAVLLALIAQEKAGEPYTKYWWGLAGVFLFISLDEALTIHEHINILLFSIYPTTGIFYWVWVIPYGAATGILCIMYLRFFFHLPARTRSLWLAAGLTFLSGALGLEMIEARHFESMGGERDAFYYSLATVEEFLEMAGAITFIYALLTYDKEPARRASRRRK